MKLSEQQVAELHRRAGLYAAEAVKRIGEHRYHGCESAQLVMLDALEPDIARGYVIGFMAGMNTAKDGAL